MPEQPEVRTPTRSATPLPRLAKWFCTCVAAFSVSVTAMSGHLLLFLLRRFLAVLLAVVGHSRLDRVLGEDRAVDLHRRQRQLLGDLRVLDGRGLVQALALHPLRDPGRGGDRRVAGVWFGV